MTRRFRFPPRFTATHGQVFVALFAFLLPVLVAPLPGSAAGDTVLYDGSLNTGTPDTQGLAYFGYGATQVFANGATTLTTSKSGQAGYTARAPLPTLDRTAGYVVRFAVQVVGEDHAGSDKNGDMLADRAGFSVIVLSSDHAGIELGFWPDQIWAQEDGAAQPPPNTNTLFTHAESGTFDTTSALVAYELHVQGDSYTLSSAGTVVVRGRLRNYSAFGAPYTNPNFLFLGDNTTSASATIRLSAVSVALDTLPPTSTPTSTPTPDHGQYGVFLPLVLRPVEPQ